MQFEKKTIADDDERDDEKAEKPFEELSVVYHTDDGQSPDFFHMKRRQKKHASGLMILASILFFILVLAFGGAYGLTRSHDRFTGTGVELTIVAPEQFTSGDTLQYVITYANHEPMLIGNVELSVRYPEGFTVIETVPSGDNVQRQETGATWTIGTLAREREGSVLIRGKLIGALGGAPTLQAILTYKPADFNAEFQEVASATTRIDESFLEAAIVGPEVVLPDAEATYVITYTNTTDTDAENVTVEAVLPTDFTIRATEPERGGILPRWTVPRLPAHGKGTIEIRGVYARSAKGAYTVRATVGVGSAEKIIIQHEADTLTNIVEGDVLVSLSLNGSAAETPIQLGELLQYSINITNSATSAISDIDVRMTAESPLLDWSTLQATARPRREGGVLTWTKKEFPALASVGAGKSATIPFSVRIVSLTPNVANDALRIRAQVVATVGSATNLPTPLTVAGNTVASQLSSNLTFGVGARYFTDDGTSVGTGPLPPRVGDGTTYRVEWTMANTLHEVLNMKAQTTLPANVEFAGAGHVPQGTLLYHPETRIVEWTLARMETRTPSIQVEYLVRLLPTEANVGSIMPLTGSMTLSARDRITSGRIALTRSALTTSLDGDEFGQGKGVVVGVVNPSH